MIGQQKPLYGGQNASSEARAIARRRAMAEALMQQGSSTAPAQSWAEGLARALQGGIGGYFAGKADREEEGRQRRTQETLAAALMAGTDRPAETRTYGEGDGATTVNWNPTKGSPQMMAQILAGNPETAQMGLGLQFQSMQAAQDRQAKMDLLKAEQAMKPPEVVEIFDEATGRPMKMQRSLGPNGWEFAPLGGVKTDLLSPEAVAQQQAIRAAGRSSTTVNIPPGAPQVGTIPQGYELANVNGGWQMRPIPGGPAAQEVEAAGQKKDQQVLQGARSGSVVLEEIGRLKDQIKNAKWYDPVLGIGGMVSQFVPGSGRADAEGLARTIKGNIGFDRLQQMREASPTGGALGSVTEQEMATLQAVLGSLEFSQSEPQLLQNLERLDAVYRGIMEKFAAYPNAAQLGVSAPSPSQPAGTGGWSIRPVQ